jgi:3',5'-cyclic AMP phosphodiesterase CpdA
MNRFVFLTDTHYWSGAPADFGAPKMLTLGRPIHEALVSAVNTLEPDFILHGGDFLCGGGSFDLDPDVYHRSIDEVKQMFGGFRAPFYGIPGNHDCDAQTWRFDAFQAAFGTPDVLDVDSVSPSLRIARANVFLGDTKTFGAGEWTDQHDERLRAADSQATKDGVPLVLCLHTWLLPSAPVPPGEDGGGCVKNASRLLNTVSECASIVAVFTGHRHLNRITAYRDFLIVDTACVIGYPFGFREVTLSDDGWFSTRFHRLDVPEVMAAYRLRDDIENDTRWEGQPHDCNRDVMIPRLLK